MILSLILGVAAYVCLVVPAAAWEVVMEPETGVLHITRAAEDTPGAVQVGIFAGSLSPYWSSGNFDETGTGCPGWYSFQSIVFDDDAYGADYVVTQGVNALVLMPNGRRQVVAPSFSNIIRKTQLVDGTGSRIVTVPVSVDGSALVSVLGTPSVSVVGTVTTGLSATMSVDGTVPVDPWTVTGVAPEVFGVGAALILVGFGSVLSWRAWSSWRELGP